MYFSGEHVWYQERPNMGEVAATVLEELVPMGPENSGIYEIRFEGDNMKKIVDGSKLLPQ
jgi:hypothetical protein